MNRWCSLLLAPLLAFAVPRPALAQTVACGCSITTGVLAACLDDIRALPADPLIPQRVVNDIFRTSDGHDARSLTFAHYYRGFAMPAGGTSPPPLDGCIGVSSSMYNGMHCPGCDCPGCTPTVCTQYQCTFDYDHSEATTHEYADALDWKWWQLNRGTWESRWLTSVTDQVADCPDINNAAECSYNPVHGFIYDLGGEANKAVIFAVTDHTTDSCLEPFEWSVWLTDNADATQVVRDGESPDPMKWNRARLDQIFLQGWTRNPAAVGLPTDTHDLTDVSGGDAQSDSPTVVFSLPCGITFRYASVMSGNYGNPGPHCAFHSAEDEVDAVAGLNTDNTALCPDADNDGFRAASCGGGDCDDHDAMVHPGALETCSAGRDLNCDGVVAMCPTNTTCVQDYCATNCIEGACADGFVCASGDGGGAQYCIPAICAGVTCPPGQICGPAGCQDPCDGAHCPFGQFCHGGACLDPCAGLACPMRQYCAVDAMGHGACVIGCSCVPCSGSAVCNTTTGRCEAPGCADTMCPAGQTRDCSGATPRCIVPCEGVTCPVGQVCDPGSGQCTRDSCYGVACPSGSHCVAGSCQVNPASDSGFMGNDSGTMMSDSGSGMLDAGSNADGSGSHLDGARGDSGPGTGESHGCGCSTAGHARTPSSSLAALALSALALGATRRRRTQRA